MAAAAAAVLVLSACGGGGEEPAPAVSESAEVLESPVPEPVVSEEPVFGPGPEGDIDRRAEEEGWAYDGSLYGAPHEFVADMCPELEGEGAAQWLVDGGYLEGDGRALLGFGVPLLCPGSVPVLEEAVGGDLARAFGDGTYDVVEGAAGVTMQDDEGEIPPGAYRAEGDLADCYWERTRADGSIVENRFATAARSISVSVRAGELFTAEGCGTWTPAE